MNYTDKNKKMQTFFSEKKRMGNIGKKTNRKNTKKR